MITKTFLDGKNKNLTKLDILQCLTNGSIFVRLKSLRHQFKYRVTKNVGYITRFDRIVHKTFYDT